MYILLEWLQPRVAVFFSPSGEITAYLDGNGIFQLNGKMYSETVRASKCHRLAQGTK